LVPLPWSARRLLLHLVPFALLLFAVGAYFSPRVVELRASGPESGFVPSPFSWPGPGNWKFEGTIRPGLRPLRHLTLRADDCVERLAVDGVAVVDAPCKAWSNWTPTRIALPPLDSATPHHLSLQVPNASGMALLSIREAGGPGFRTLLVLLLAGALWMAVVAGTGRPSWVFWAGAASILLGGLLHEVGDPWLRQHDIGGHREYVSFVLDRWEIPPILQGWETFQPPLYYFVAAAAHRLWEATTWEDPARGMQALAAAAFVLTVLVAALFVSRRDSKGPQLLPVALLALLPAHLLLAGRISNDSLLPLLGGLALAAMATGMESGSRASFASGGAALALALATKSSSIALLGAAALLVVFAEPSAWREPRRRATDALLLLGPGAAVALLVAVRSWRQTGSPFFAPTALLPANQVVPNTFWKFLSFDPVALVREGAFDYEGGRIRESLATSLAATSAAADEQLAWLEDPLLPILAPAFLAVVLLVAIGLVVPPRRRESDLVPWLLSLSFLAFLWLYNFRSPYSSCENARLLAPVFVPLTLVAARGQSLLLGRWGNRWTRGFARLLPLPFLVASASLLLRLVLW
jgi:hypothetical protein